MQQLSHSKNIKLLQFSIIIPAFNRAHLIGQTIESLINQTFPSDSYEILVCDNNSEDNTKEVVESFIKNKRDVKIRYFLERRQGVHFARNATAQKAEGKYFYFTDDDMIANFNILEEFSKWIKIFPEVKVFGGKVLPKWATNPPFWITQFFANSTLSLIDRSEEILISQTDPGIASCHQLICRDIFFEAGGFRPEYTKDEWLGDGETGLNLQISRLGYLFGYFSSAITHHIIPSQRMTMEYICKRFKNQGQADAFTYYRAFEPSNRILQKLKLRHSLLSWNEQLKAILLKCRGREEWRLHQANSSLEAGFSSYAKKLITCPKLRKIAVKKSYLD
jgi:glycosyltransferase involved in cell wall biosynthesis